ncbi:tRNA glutamyl-Q(34) synthetase GluQRS [uncultured Methylibium sp.]|uniref:tRNA glutamyl-Q(34) synthetase GluQRS n=1 Tax=uncultured Methylibium sp. TaxID=381093 RepID=UPI0025D32E99|nr:tRNA glutamyl-Q(34) synthetase GluQRS [uncultured Methylibium sp.]
MAYVGRFAPSPTGPLHAGSLVAALGSWLDARAHGGRWLLRIEDVDTPRCVPGADMEILRQLDALGLRADEPPQWQSRREAPYAAALDRLIAAGRVYPCACTRQDIVLALAAQGRTRERHAELTYPGTCRPEHGGLRGRAARTWRLRVDDGAMLRWTDRRLGAQVQDVAAEVGDFVLRRADGLWAYQLAVVVDDAEQAVTDIVRGEDLADNTPRQILLQRALDLPTPRYLHLPLVRAADGEKLSKQHGAPPLDTDDPQGVLAAAASVLGLVLDRQASTAAWLDTAVAAWRRAGRPAGV